MRRGNGRRADLQGGLGIASGRFAGGEHHEACQQHRRQRDNHKGPPPAGCRACSSYKSAHDVQVKAKRHWPHSWTLWEERAHHGEPPLGASRSGEKTYPCQVPMMEWARWPAFCTTTSSMVHVCSGRGDGGRTHKARDGLPRGQTGAGRDLDAGRHARPPRHLEQVAHLRLGSQSESDVHQPLQDDPTF